MKNVTLKLLFLFVSFNAYSAVSELSANFSYDRSTYGSNMDNKLVSRTYGASWAWYFWGLTAIEFNYSLRDEILTINDDKDLGSGIIIRSQQDRVKTEVFGVGIRQSLTPKGAFITPFISVGYAKQFKKGLTTFQIEDNGTYEELSFQSENSRQDSVFATFGLKLQVTKTMTLNGSIRTVFKAFEWSEAKNTIRYAAGFSWFF